MPLTRSSEQPGKTLIEFYSELTTPGRCETDIRIGNAMLNFMEWINKTFIETNIVGFTSLYHLVLLSDDSWKSNWFVKIISSGTNEYYFEYLMPEGKSPWEHALVKGETNNFDEAKRYLIIAMTESGGWKESNELKKIYNQLLIDKRKL